MQSHKEVAVVDGWDTKHIGSTGLMRFSQQKEANVLKFSVSSLTSLSCQSLTVELLKDSMFCQKYV